MPSFNRKLVYALVSSALVSPTLSLAENELGFSWRPDFDFVENPDIGDNTSDDFEDIDPGPDQEPDQEPTNTEFERTQYPSNNYNSQLSQPLAGPSDITEPPNQFSCSASVHDYSRPYVESYQTGPSLNSKCGFQQLLNFNLIDKFSLSGLISGSFCGFARSIVNPAIQAVNSEITRVNTYIPSNAELSVNGTWELTDTGPVAELSWNLRDDASYYDTLNNSESYSYEFEPVTPNTDWSVGEDEATDALLTQCLENPDGPLCTDPAIQAYIFGTPHQNTAPSPPIGQQEPLNTWEEESTIEDFDTSVDINIDGNETQPAQQDASQTEPAESTDPPVERSDNNTVQDDGSISWGDTFDRFFSDP